MDGDSALPDTGLAWHPYSVACRTVNWLKFFAANRGADVDGTRTGAVLRQCLAAADFIEWMQERDIEANHWLKNLWAIALIDLLLAPSPRGAADSVQRYLRELSAQLLSDGAHYELSPMYHAKVVADARLLLAALHPDSDEAARLSGLLARSACWLEHLRLGARSWANFNDSWHIPELAESLWGDEDMEGWVPQPGVFHMEPSGYIRGNESTGWRWILDVGGVGPSFNPGHCHSDVLSLVVNWKGEPVLVDPGTLHYSPNDERAFLKSCHAHNGPCLAESDHTEMIGSFRIGRATQGRGLVNASGPALQDAEGSHRGYGDCLVRRRVAAAATGVRVSDSWLPETGCSGRPWSRMLLPVGIRGLRDLEVTSSRIGFCFPSGHPLECLKVKIEARGFDRPRMCVAESFHSPTFGRSEPATEAVVTGGRLAVPATLEAIFEIR